MMHAEWIKAGRPAMREVEVGANCRLRKLAHFVPDAPDGKPALRAADGSLVGVARWHRGGGRNINGTIVH